MCVVSMVMDHYDDKWKQFPWNQPIPPSIPFPQGDVFNPKGPTKEEFEELRKDVEELKSLLKRAIKYDEKNNEPNCEIEEKVAKVREICKLVGVDIDEILNKKEL